MSGRFISFEGGEGAGKSTQARLLAEWLRGQGIDVVETREPGGTPGGDAIRDLLLGSHVALGPTAETYLFAAARAEHVDTLIAPALAAGKWVVCDRFLDSSLAYQGAAGGLGMARVAIINAEAVANAEPDLTILLRLETGDATARALERDGPEQDRFTARDLAFHQSVAAAFDRLHSEEPHRIVAVDASGSIEEVATRVAEAVQARLL